MNHCILEKVVKEKNIVKYLYNVEGEWEKYFALDQEYFIEYDMDIEQVPDSILSIPFIGNIIVLAALFKAQIQLKDVDLDFLNSIPEFMDGYRKMYPELDINYNEVVLYENAVICDQKAETGKSMLLFSGGVDAYSSLITHEKEKPLLVTICGAEIESDNDKAWTKVIRENEKTAHLHDLPIVGIKSSFRKIFRNDLLDNWSLNAVADNWWHAFHHSVSMMTLAAPNAYVSRTGICYFASTKSIYTGEYRVASDPSIDNYVRFCGCQVVHDGFEFGRHEKIARICEYKRSTGKNIKLRVCYKSKDGNNCSICRKCVFTMMSILLEKENPDDFGFCYNTDNFSELFASGIQEMLKGTSVTYSYALEKLDEIQRRYRQSISIDMVPRELKLFYKSDIEDLIHFLRTPCNGCREKDVIIKHLQGENENGQSWIEELEKGKRWLEQQVQYKDERISELLEWIKELEKGKMWLETQLQNQQKEN